MTKIPAALAPSALNPGTITKAKNKSHVPGGNVCTVDVRIATRDK
jgi:hypothetical protein